MSLTLARCGVKHRIISQKNVIRNANHIHMVELGKSFYNPTSHVAVAGVDTLIRRTDDLTNWIPSVRLTIIDEAHHVLKENKWGKACSLFQNSKILGVTATPLRADGKGLGFHNDGLFHELLCGPTMRELIDQRYLSDYRIFAPASDIDISNIPIGSTGDYNLKQLKKAAQVSHIVGDVVEHYMRIAPGKLGVTFATDIETATIIANRYRECGIPAEVVTSKTPDRQRVSIIQRFKKRHILQLVNVDIFGEGFDLPAVEVISMARPTASYGLYTQQFGRALRPLEGKQSAIIIDHVRNIIRHGLPDCEREWSLEARNKRSQSSNDLPRVRICQHCTAVYRAILNNCPECGYHYVPSVRSSPEQVDGDLQELSPEALAVLRGNRAKIDEPVDNYKNRLSHYMSGVTLNSAVKNHRDRQSAQERLRNTIASWAGVCKFNGMDDSRIYKEFYAQWGIDILSAQSLGKMEAERLNERIIGRV